jgi:hypothetical protein
MPTDRYSEEIYILRGSKIGFCGKFYKAVSVENRVLLKKVMFLTKVYT